jgi:hypothetical protein
MKINSDIERADKISVVNALMAEDREELRFHKNVFFSATIIFISGFVGISAYFINSFWSKSLARHQYYLPVAAIWMLFGYYLFIFLFLKRFVESVRKSLDIREQYYKNLTLFDSEQPFNPLKSIAEAGVKHPSIPDNYLWALLVVAFTAALANSIAVYYIFNFSSR